MTQLTVMETRAALWGPRLRRRASLAGGTPAVSPPPGRLSDANIVALAALKPGNVGYVAPAYGKPKPVVDTAFLRDVAANAAALRAAWVEYTREWVPWVVQEFRIYSPGQPYAVKKDPRGKLYTLMVGLTALVPEWISPLDALPAAVVRAAPTADEAAWLAAFDKATRGTPEIIQMGGPWQNMLGIDPRAFMYKAPGEWQDRRKGGAVYWRVLNLGTALGILENYPWPGPSYQFAQAFREFLGAPLLSYCDTPARISEEEMRAWVMFALLEKFDEVTDRVEALVQKKVRKKQRLAMVRGAALAVVGLAVGFMLSGAALAAAKLGMRQLDAQVKKDLKGSLKSIAGEFADGEPAFAAELNRVVAYVDANTPPEPEAAAPVPGRVPMDPVLPEGTRPPAPAEATAAPTGLLVAGGGLLLLLLLSGGK